MLSVPKEQVTNSDSTARPLILGKDESTTQSWAMPNSCTPEENQSVQMRGQQGLQIFFHTFKTDNVEYHKDIRALLDVLKIGDWLRDKEWGQGHYDIDSCPRLIAKYLEEHSFKSLDQRSQLQNFLMVLLGWGENPIRPGTPAAVRTEMRRPSSPLYHKARAINSIAESWTKLLKKKIIESYQKDHATTQ